MKTNRLFWLLTAPLFVVPFSSGCMFIKAPEPEATPTPAPTPKAPFFDPTAGLTRGKALNSTTDPKLPEAFRVASPISGDTISIQTLKRAVVPVTAAGAATTGAASATPLASSSSASVAPPSAAASNTVSNAASSSSLSGSEDSSSSASGRSADGSAPVAQSPLLPGTLETVKLAGIVAPTQDPGMTGAKLAIMAWTQGQNLDVDQDVKFPTDINGQKLVQIYFKGRPGPYAGQTMSLNRMLVRSGWAVVDLYSPTSFDTSQWIYDEAHARMHKLGFWKYGQAIQQRVPVQTLLGTTTKIKGSKSIVTIVPTTRGGITSGTVSNGAVSSGATSPSGSSTTTTITTTTTTSNLPSPAIPPAQPAPSAAASSSG